jgi:hypothetical protein
VINCVFQCYTIGFRAHETLVAVSGYLLGEIGVTICEKPGMSGLDQLTALTQHLAGVSDKV